MKLYTEEQVRKAIELSRDTHYEGRAYMEREEYDYSMDEVVDFLIPIKLPSDEEIEASMFPLNSPEQELYNGGREEGAKWMRNKIQGGEQ